MTHFGRYLRSLRLQAGLGLRSFAKLIDQRPSTVSAIEQGLRLPWQTRAALQQVANVLGVELDSAAYELLVDLAAGSADRGGTKSDVLTPLLAIGSADLEFEEETIEGVLNHLEKV